MLEMKSSLNTVQVDYEWTDKPEIAKDWLESLTTTTAFDFEVASRFNKEQRKEAIHTLDSIDSYKQAYTTGLSYPENTILTHLGFSNSDNFGRVIVLDDDLTTEVVLDYLTSTNILQIWHNAVFDFRHIHFYTGKFPKNYEDTRLMVKSIKNNVNNFLGSTSLKLLMKKFYGEWEKERVDFEIENKYNEKLLEYTATDVCATYKLYNILLKQKKD